MQPIINGKFEQSIRVLPFHDAWMNAATLILGYTWFVSGLDKILRTDFVVGFFNYAEFQIAQPTVFDWYKSILTQYILPHSILVANAIQFTELVIGIMLIVGSLWNFFSHSRVVHYGLTLASAISFLLILNMIFLQGTPFPWVNPVHIFEEGVDLDFVVLFLSFFWTIANFIEARQEKTVLIS